MTRQGALEVEEALTFDAPGHGARRSAVFVDQKAFGTVHSIGLEVVECRPRASTGLYVAKPVSPCRSLRGRDPRVVLALVSVRKALYSVTRTQLRVKSG